MANQEVIILGAGLAGLSAAYHLQKEGVACQIFEKEAEVGGLCRSKKLDGFTFDYDGHLLHFRHQYTFDLVKSLLKGNFIKHNRSAWVYSHERFIPYPFQTNLVNLPVDVAQECLAGFLAANKNGRVKANESFLHWIDRTSGKGIARHFMVPYNTKFWTISPRRMVCDWLDGFVPQPTVAQVMDGATKEGGQPLGYNACFWYPEKGGIEQLSLAMKSRIEHIHTGFEVKTIDLKARQIEFANGVKKKYHHLISTIPLPQLPGIVKGLPKDVREAFSKLRWNSVYNLNLGLSQKKRCESHWIYFPQKELVFFRVGFFHNFSSGLVPEGKTSIYAEVAYCKQKPVDKKKVAGRIEKDLKKVGLLSDEDEVLVRDSNDIQCAYPIYDRNYKASRSRILGFLSKHHILTCGRYGSWRYMSMEDVLLEGREFSGKQFG